MVSQHVAPLLVKGWGGQVARWLEDGEPPPRYRNLTTTLFRKQYGRNCRWGGICPGEVGFAG